MRTNLKTSLIRRNVPLHRFCTMQVGGPAMYFSEPEREDELMEVLDFARQENVPFMILGKGSNVIFPDEGYKGLVITLIHYEQDRILIDREKQNVTASGGIFLYRLILACRDQHLSGIEFLCNVPGTVGGAVIMNAGFSRFPGQKNEIGSLINEVTVLNPYGQKEVLTKKDLVFSYRKSNLQGKIILEANLQLWARDYDFIESEIKANFDYRNEKQDLRHPSSGSIFKNPAAPLESAGKLIEKAGLKGLKVGGAMVSPKHGNYIINADQAKSSDIVELIEKIQKAIFNETGVLLEPEVRLIKNP